MVGNLVRSKKLRNKPIEYNKKIDGKTTSEIKTTSDDFLVTHVYTYIKNPKMFLS